MHAAPAAPSHHSFLHLHLHLHLHFIPSHHSFLHQVALQYYGDAAGSSAGVKVISRATALYDEAEALARHKVSRRVTDVV